MAKKSRNIFQLLNEVFYGKTPWEELDQSEQKAFSVYMINRFISMDPAYVELIADLQKYTMGTMTAEMVYKMYQEIFPKRKFFRKYIKAKGTSSDKYDKLVEFLSSELGWSTSETFENLQILMKKEKDTGFLRDFLSKRGVSEKDIKKIYHVK